MCKYFFGCTDRKRVYLGCMDFSDRIPNISALLFKMGGGSYDKLYRQIHGTLPVTMEARAKAIDTASGGVIGWREILVKKAHRATSDAA